MGLTGPMEVWLKTVRGQDKRGVPLATRRTTNPEALDQTATLQHYRTMTHISLMEKSQPGQNLCQQCGAPLPADLAGCKVKRAVYLPSGVLWFYVGPECVSEVKV